MYINFQQNQVKTQAMTVHTSLLIRKIRLNIVIVRLLWEVYTFMNIPMRTFKILRNFVYSGILQ